MKNHLIAFLLLYYTALLLFLCTMDTLNTEQALYEKEKERLLAEGEGKYVVIKGDKLLNFFDTEEDALKAGYAQFGAEDPFLIRKVSRVEGAYFFSPSPLHNALFEPRS